ncbi:MAG: secretin N-terminal domain-containing protein [Planctomycetota bacterium]
MLIGLAPHAWAQAAGAGDEDELIDFNPPPEMRLDLLIKMVSDELSLKVLYDEKVGSQSVRLLLGEKIPRSSMRGILESALRIKGFALVEGDQPGWLSVVEAKDLLNIAPPPGDAEGALEGQKATAALTRVFKLEHVDPKQVEQVVRPYLTTPGGNLQVIEPQRLVIVTDYTPRVARIGKVLGLLDQPAREVEARFYEMKHISAAEAAAELTRILQAARRAEQAAGPGQQASRLGLEILQQERTNRLVMIGEPERLDEAIGLIGSIDVDLGLETRLYRFNSVSPGKVDQLVQNLIDPGEQKRLYRSSADEENGLLVVTTTPGIHERVAAVQGDLDREIESAQPVLRYYKLKNAKAEEVLATIQQLGGQTVLVPGPRGPVPAPLPDDEAEQPRGINRDNLFENPLSGRIDPRFPLVEARPGLIPGGTRPVVAFSTLVQTEDATLVPDINTNTIIVLAEGARQAFYEDLIKQLDKRRPQVMIEVTLVALNTSDGSSVGVEISRTGDADDEPRVLSFSSFGLSDSTDPADLLAVSGLGFNGVILSEDIANVVIRALKTDGSSRVFSTPKLLVNDNASGTLSSTLDIPFLSLNTVDGVQRETVGGSSDAGTSIELSPQISEGDHIKLAYGIEFSSFGEGGSDTLPPPKSSQNVSSEVTIPDGHTVVIGGLSSTDYGESVSRVPILGEIPVLEYLLSSRSKNSSETTFFVFIKPLILRDDGFADLKFLTQRDLAAAGLPGDYPQSEPLLME